MNLLTYTCIVVIITLMATLLHGNDKTVGACTASHYSEECRGKPMANGHPFDPDALTCASHYYPLGTSLLITHDNKSVEVLVTDRGPAKKHLSTRQLDLSRAAFMRLAPLSDGLVQVKVSRLSP